MANDKGLDDKELDRATDVVAAQEVHANRARELWYKAVLGAIQRLGVALTVVGGLFAAAKTASDLNASSQRDLREQISTASAFYTASADRAIWIKLAHQPLEDDLLFTSLTQTILKPPPHFTAGPFEFYLRGMIQSGYTQVCQDREYSIETHYASADAATKARFDQFIGQLRKGAGKDAENVGGFEKRCRKLIGAATTSAISALGKASEGLGRQAEINRKPVSSAGWDVDVLYCDTAGDKRVADQLAAALGRAADKRTAIGGERIGRVLKLAGSGTTSNIIVFDPEEATFAAAVADFANATTKKDFSVVENTGTRTRWYVSAFVCGEP